MSIFFTQLLLPIISTMVTGLAMWWLKKQDNKREKRYAERDVKRAEEEAKMSALENGLQAILRDRIIQLYSYCENRGYVAVYEEQNMSMMYKAYHELNGNGLVTSLYKKFVQLPVKGGVRRENYS